MTLAEYWDLTPRETYSTIEAAIWRDRQDQKQQIVMAWRIAALSRSKKLPTLKKLLNVEPAKPLVGAERVRRRKEFSEMSAVVDLKSINAQMKQRKPRG